MTGYRDLDVGGVDSYNQDSTMTSDSLGGMIVLRRNERLIMNEKDMAGTVPVCIYYNRPRRKEIFYDICLKISVFYNLVKNTMISADEDLIINHYRNNNGTKYLSPRPRSVDAPGGKQVHRYGVKSTGHSKPIMIGLAQNFLLDYCHMIWFEILIKDFLAYDKERQGTDWDLADACMYALVRIEDMKGIPQKSTYTNEEDPFDVQSEWVRDKVGNIRLVQKNAGMSREKMSNVSGMVVNVSENLRDDWGCDFR